MFTHVTDHQAKSKQETYHPSREEKKNLFARRKGEGEEREAPAKQPTEKRG